MLLDDVTLQKLLWDRQLLTKEQLEQAVLLAPSLGKSFADTLVFKHYIEEDVLGKVMAEGMGVGYINLKAQAIPPEILNLVPEEAAITHKLVPFARSGNELQVAMSDPSDFGIINFLEKQTGLIIKPFFAFQSQILGAQSQYKKDIRAAFEKILKEVQQNAPQGDLAKVAEEAPIVQMLETVIDYAIAEGASDIHIEGQESNMIIRFRIDGTLRDVLILSSTLQPALVARIKVLCNLKLDEHRLPQDGRFKFEHTGTRIAMRVSIIPSFFAENVVMRLLPEATKAMTLEEVGFTPANAEMITNQIKAPNGIILLTGPTGSGKTTTLYSIIEMLNKPEVSIVTIEDPVEYGMPRVSQIQVNSETGLDFASGLRSILRHDPNIIMVGEIRDQDTADISMNASLTGHLVLSTLHTNDAPSSIPRLIDLGVEPYLITATLRMVVAQRLVRRLCSKCAQPEAVPEALLQHIAQLTGFSLDELKTKQFMAAQGCPECSSGYKGRIGIHELLVINEAISELILSRPSNDKMRAAAIQNGMYTMVQDGVAKAAAGLTTITEIMRKAEH